MNGLSGPFSQGPSFVKGLSGPYADGIPRDVVGVYRDLDLRTFLYPFPIQGFSKAEMAWKPGETGPLREVNCEHFDLRAGSGEGVQVPCLKRTFLYPGQTAPVCKSPT